jgi:hypothetical protein
VENVRHLMVHGDNPRKYERRIVGFFDEWLLGK